MDVTRRQRAFLLASLALVVGVLAVYSAHNAFGLGGEAFDAFAQAWLYNGLIVTAALFCLARGIFSTKERAAWLLFGVGIASWSAGEIYFTLALEDLAEPPYPSLSDLLYLAFYPASYLALVSLVRVRMREFSLGMWVDGVVAALAVAALGSAVLLQPVLAVTGGNTATVVTDLAYPLADVLLLALVVAVFAMTGWRPGRAWAFIGAGLMTTALADGIFLYQATNGTYGHGTILDSLWPASTLLLAYAAWQRPQPATSVRLDGWRVLVVPSVFALTALGLLMYARIETVTDVSAGLAAATLVAVIVRMALTFRDNLRVVAASRREALTDALTGLANRRRLLCDLEDEVQAATPEEPSLLLLFDLDGFKRYNDTYGHQAGDALLARLGHNLDEAIGPHGRAYRLGGDEFCALLTGEGAKLPEVVATAAEALSDSSKGFEVSASHGTVLLPTEADDPVRALQVADQRMYGGKNGRRTSSIGKQTCDALLQALQEKRPDLRDHIDHVTELAVGVGRRMGMLPDELDEMTRAAELHDIGKMAIPDAILNKPGGFDETEWRLVRQHTLVGERILSAAPALTPVAKLVRASHERWDGNGYPDGLTEDEIPLGARIIAVCDSYHAMTSVRAYREPVSTEEALAELRRCGGAQFDPAIVEVFCQEATAGSFVPTPVPAMARAEQKPALRPAPALAPAAVSH